MAEVEAAFELRLSHLHWLGDDPREDFCAHAAVRLRIGGEVTEQAALNVTAASLLLLRTLRSDHRLRAPDGAFDFERRVDASAEQLVPCCGHAWSTWRAERPYLCSCPNGIDFGVRHDGSAIELRSPGGAPVVVTRRAWTDAVCRFADTVDAFYRRSEPKVVIEGDPWWDGYRAMRREWRHRRSLVTRSA